MYGRRPPAAITVATAFATLGLHPAMEILPTTFATLNGLGPLPGAGLAEGVNHSLLAIVLMVAGAVVLRQALRSRRERDDQVLKHPGRVAPVTSLPESTRPQEPEPQGDPDARAVLTEVKHLRRVLADEADRHAERLEALIARAEETIRRLETLSMSDAAARTQMRGENGGHGIDPLNRRIYELADQGLPPVDIARSLNQQTGKVELVLALRPR